MGKRCKSVIPPEIVPFIEKSARRERIFNTYYWYILHLDPYTDTIRIINTVDHPRHVRHYFQTAQREVSWGGRNPHTGEKIFTWLIREGGSSLPLLHTRDGRPITVLEDVKKLWGEVGIKPIDPLKLEEKAEGNNAYYISLVEREHRKAYEALEAYFAPEINKIEDMLRKEADKIWETSKPPGQGVSAKTPEAGGKGEFTYYYVMQDTKEGSKRVSKGILSGEKGKHTFTRLPALAMAEYIRASNEGVKNPKDIEKSVIDNVPEWQRLKTKGQKPNTKYIKKAIKCGIKKATARDVIPFNPIPFKISLDTE